jgi:hypothetical protein
MSRKPKETSQGLDPRAGKEVLLLWAILGEGAGDEVSRSALDNKGMLPSGDKVAREALAARGLIKVEKRTSRNEKGRSTSGYWLSVTEAGRGWAEENLAAMPAKSQAAAPTLQAWLKRLSIFLHARNISIAEFLGLEPGTSRETHVDVEIVSPIPSQVPPSLHASEYETLRARIREAYLAVTGNRVNARARLCHVREKLSHIERGALDEALKRMQREQQASLYPLDNKSEITDADRNAAIHFGSEPRHLLWIER